MALQFFDKSNVWNKCTMYILFSFVYKMRSFVQPTIFIMLMVQISDGKLLPCSKITQKVCTKSEDYVGEISPDPLPTPINLTLKFFEITGVDETKQTVTLSMKTIVEWQDHRLDVNRSKDNTQK